jgi:DNA-binding FrmR family transcriptional regulator
VNGCNIENKKLINRINRIEGQVKALKGRLIEEINCEDSKDPYEIIRQLRAIRGAVNGMINSYIEHFAKEHLLKEIRQESDEAKALATMDSLIDIIKYGIK